MDRKQRFEEALGFQAEAQMLVASGWAMNRCYETVDVTDYFGDRPRKRTLRLDPTRTMRENIDRMFQHYRKAERGLKMVEKELATLVAREGNLAQDAEQIRSIGNWDSWNAEFGSHAKPQAGARGIQGRSFREGCRFCSNFGLAEAHLSLRVRTVAFRTSPSAS